MWRAAEREENKEEKIGDEWNNICRRHIIFP
jgi:hypothetical protein